MTPYMIEKGMLSTKELLASSKEKKKTKPFFFFCKQAFLGLLKGSS